MAQPESASLKLRQGSVFATGGGEANGPRRRYEGNWRRAEEDLDELPSIKVHTTGSLSRTFAPDRANTAKDPFIQDNPGIGKLPSPDKQDGERKITR